MNERESRFNQSVTGAQLVYKIVTLPSTPTTVYASINEAVSEVHTMVGQWGQGSHTQLENYNAIYNRCTFYEQLLSMAAQQGA